VPEACGISAHSFQITVHRPGKDTYNSEISELDCLLSFPDQLDNARKSRQKDNPESRLMSLDAGLEIAGSGNQSYLQGLMNMPLI
jgi:hypothetical protein